MFALLMTLIMIFLIVIYAGVRRGRHPCLNGLSDKCNSTNMDDYCLNNPGGDPRACQTFCRTMHRLSLANDDVDVCESEYCSHIGLNPTIALWCRQKGAKEYPRVASAYRGTKRWERFQKMQSEL